MKFLSVTDHIYYCVYSAIMKTPSRDQPHATSASVMGGLVFMHTVGLLVFINFKGGILLAPDKAKMIIIVLGVLLLYGSWVYYIRGKNGERIIKAYADKIDKRTAVIIGFIVALEMCAFPLINGLIWILFFAQKL